MKKNLTKLMATILMVFAVMIICKVPVSAAEANFRMTSNPAAGDGKIEVAWNYLTPADISGSATAINYFYIEDRDENTTNPLYGTGASGTFDLGYTNTWYLYCNYSTDYGTYNSYLGYTYVNNSPVKLDKTNYKVDYVNKNSLYVQTATPDSASGVELAVYQGSKLIKKSTGYTYPSVTGLKQNVVYTVKVRCYYDNYTTGNRYYGAWSPARKYVNIKASLKAKSNKKGINVSALKKISGVTKYKIYVSTKRDKGFKLSKTITVGKKSSYSAQITKNVKKKKTNYVKIVPVIKGYGDSDVFAIGSIYDYK